MADISKKVSIDLENFGLIDRISEISGSARQMAQEMIVEARQYSTSAQEVNKYLEERIRLIDRSTRSQADEQKIRVRERFSQQVESVQGAPAFDQKTKIAEFAEERKQAEQQLSDQLEEDKFQTQVLKDILEELRIKAKHEIGETPDEVSRLLKENEARLESKEIEVDEAFAAYKQTIQRDELGKKQDSEEIERDFNIPRVGGQRLIGAGTQAAVGGDVIFGAAALAGTIPLVGAGLSQLVGKMLGDATELEEARLQVSRIRGTMVTGQPGMEYKFDPTRIVKERERELQKREYSDAIDLNIVRPEGEQQRALPTGAFSKDLVKELQTGEKRVKEFTQPSGGTFGEFNMEKFGKSAAEFLTQNVAPILQARGFRGGRELDTRESRESILLEKGLGIDVGVQTQFQKGLRQDETPETGSQVILNSLRAFATSGLLGESNVDMRLVPELLEIQNQLVQDQTQRLMTVDIEQNARLIAAFEEAGFENPAVMGKIISAVDQGMRQPANDYVQALQYTTLAQMMPGASLWEIQKMQAKGLQEPEVFDKFMGQLEKMSGGNTEAMFHAVQGVFPQLEPEQIESLTTGFQKGEFKGLKKDEFQERMKRVTDQPDTKKVEGLPEQIKDLASLAELFGAAELIESQKKATNSFAQMGISAINFVDGVQEIWKGTESLGEALENVKITFEELSIFGRTVLNASGATNPSNATVEGK